MTTRHILESIGTFSATDLDMFEGCITSEQYNKNQVLLKEGEVCRSLYFITSGSFVQWQTREPDDVIIDLHLEHEWMYNQESLVTQMPSRTTITAFTPSEVLRLTLQNFHYLAARSPAFLQFGKLMNQDQNRTFIFDQSLTPGERYHHICLAKPLLAQVFPVKMIASFLKMAPETLSRVRARV